MLEASVETSVNNGEFLRLLIRFQKSEIFVLVCFVCSECWMLNDEPKWNIKKKKSYSIQIRLAWIVSSVFHLNDFNTSLGLKYTSIETNRCDKSAKTNGANGRAIKSGYEQIGSNTEEKKSIWKMVEDEYDKRFR